MYSIIVCSISPERLELLSQNIHDTIGVEYEIIGIDNRLLKWPIAKVYNKGAKQAHYPYLFFVHEDVLFHTNNWGGIIASKLQEPNCGVIGFAGSFFKPKSYSGWYVGPEWSCSLLLQGTNNGKIIDSCNIIPNTNFTEVITVDGFAMFVRKEVWEKFPFDDNRLTSFHCYDLDFSLAIASSRIFKNYVCSTPKVFIEHFSPGNYNFDWYQTTVKLHQTKWRKILPLKTESIILEDKKIQEIESRVFHSFCSNLLQERGHKQKKLLLQILLKSNSWSELHIGLKCLFHYFKKRTKHKQE